MPCCTAATAPPAAPAPRQTHRTTQRAGQSWVMSWSAPAPLAVPRRQGTRASAAATRASGGASLRALLLKLQGELRRLCCVWDVALLSADSQCTKIQRSSTVSSQSSSHDQNSTNCLLTTVDFLLNWYWCQPINGWEGKQ